MMDKIKIAEVHITLRELINKREELQLKVLTLNNQIALDKSLTYMYEQSSDLDNIAEGIRTNVMKRDQARKQFEEIDGRIIKILQED